MSALGLDDRRGADGVPSYAPRRQHHADDDRSIRPVLERLKRAETPGSAPRRPREPVVQHAAPDDIGPALRNPMSMTARLLVAIGLLAATAAIGAGFLVPPEVTGAANPKAAPAPESKLATVNVGKSDRIVEQSAAVKDQASVAKDQASIVAERASAVSDAGRTSPLTVADASGAAPAAPAMAAASQSPAASPLKLWAMMPADLPPAVPPAGQAAMDEAAAPPPHPAAEDAPSKPAAGHHARRVTHHRRSHHRRRATVARAPAQPAQTESVQSQATKKLPLQAAIDRLFGNGGATTGAQAQPQPQR
jgi:hypothetical protein